MRWVVLPVALGVACGGCGRAPEERVTIDLTSIARAVIDGERTALPVEGAGGSRRIRQAGPESIDLYLRLPEDGRLLFETEPDAARADLGVEVATDGEARSLELERAPSGAWRADLFDFDGDVARLRLENRSHGALSWVRPRITGVAERIPPALGPEQRPPQTPVSVILYVLDTLRRDRLSLYGYEQPTSPNLEELAENGLVFMNAYAPGPLTGPTITALFTSRHPSRIQGDLSTERAPRTLAEAFREAGHRTAAFQANFTLFETYGFDRGFDLYARLRHRTEEGPRSLRAAELHERALDWLRRHGDRPFFLYIQSMDAHGPYDPPPAFRGRFGPVLEELMDDRVPGGKQEISGLELRSARYDEDVAYADREIGRFFQAVRDMGLLERTAVIITSDHGESFGEHGLVSHGHGLYEELVHVPLLMLLPWHPSAERVETVVSLKGLGPTLLDLAGLLVPEAFEGESFFEPGSSLDPPCAAGVRLHLNRGPEGWYLREGPWKLLLNDEGARLFHLPDDPGETRDLSGEHPIRAEYMTLDLIDRSPSLRGPWTLDPHPMIHMNPEKRRQVEEALRALGYIE